VAHSSRGLGHLPLKEEITGSNPVCATIHNFFALWELRMLLEPIANFHLETGWRNNCGVRSLLYDSNHSEDDSTHCNVTERNWEAGSVNRGRSRHALEFAIRLRRSDVKRVLTPVGRCLTLVDLLIKVRMRL
jgi:hypothetical protein